jgi:TonB family protein
MFSAARTAPLTRSGPRPQPIALSLVAHAGILSLVVLGPVPHASRRPQTLYDQVIKAHEHELVWYSFRQKLPEVSPPEMQHSQLAGAELKSPGQTIISNPKQGERGVQMIWRAAPQVKPQPQVPSPNILAFRLPAIPAPPPGPPRKLFVPPETRRRKLPDPVSLPEPPKVQAQRQAPAVVATLVAAIERRPTPRNFVAPVSKPARQVAVEALPEAPGISTALRSERVPMLAENMAAALANKPQARTFVPPAARVRPSTGPVALPDAPKIATQLASAGTVAQKLAIQDVSAAALANKPKPREFVAPALVAGGGRGRNGSAGVSLLEEAPAVNAAGMPSSTVNVAVVGLNPAAKLAGPLPDGSREAKFSAGPNVNGGAGVDGSAVSSALTVPGLLIHGGTSPQSPSNPLLIARAAPTSRPALEAAVKAAGARGESDPPAPEIHLSPAPDPQFSGRDVYTLAVQMPNITSYVGTWIMWFAERTPQGPRGRSGLHPPVPLHKVDPRYQPSAISERVEGKVQIAGVIRTDGHVELLRILKSVDARLDQSAEEALRKWEFEPAKRDGSPVEVDVVAEIPFQLAPQVKR